MISISMSTFFILVCIFLAYRLVCYFINLQIVHQKLAHIPGPTIKEVIGQIWRYFFLMEPIAVKANRFACQLCDRYGDQRGIAKISLGFFRPHLVVFEEKLAKKILAHPDFQNKADVYRFLGNVFSGNGIFTCDGTKAKTYRLELRQHFFTKLLESYIASFSANLELLDNKINQMIKNSKAEGVLQNVKPTISALVLDQLGDSLLSVHFNAQQTGEPAFIKPLEYVINEMNWIMIEQWKTTPSSSLLNHLFFLLHPTFWRLPKLLFSVVYFKLSVLNTVLKLYWRIYRRQKLNDNFKPSSMMETVVNRRVTCALKTFTSTSKSIWQQISALRTGFLEATWHLTVFTIAGHLTTTTALTWTLYYLCKHEKVRRKLQQEVDDILAESYPMNEVLTNKSLLKYMEAVLKETLRLAPVAPYLGRKATAEVRFPVNSIGNGFEKEFITIPAGTNVSIMAQYMQTSERYHPEANSYIPERWLKDSEKIQEEEEVKEEVKKAITHSNTAVYFPFSAGNRACFGEKYALLQMKVTLLTICRKYDFTFAQPDTICKPLHYLAQTPAKFAIKFSHRKSSVEQS